jgi:hypothetical protein
LQQASKSFGRCLVGQFLKVEILHLDFPADQPTAALGLPSRGTAEIPGVHNDPVVMPLLPGFSIDSFNFQVCIHSHKRCTPGHQMSGETEHQAPPSDQNCSPPGADAGPRSGPVKSHRCNLQPLTARAAGRLHPAALLF